MDAQKRRVALRKILFAALWSVVFFLLTSVSCLVYFSATAYEFADLSMMEILDDEGQPTAAQTAYRDTGSKVIYGFLTMQESDIFLGLFLFSVVVSTFGAYVGILPGTDEETLAAMIEKADQDVKVSLFALSPNCPNCGAEVTGNFCAQCGQSKASAQELTLGNFMRHFIPEILNIDSKFFRSLGILIRKPGFLTLEYLRFRHASYTLPTQMYFVVAAVFFLVSINLDISTDVLLKQPQFAEQLAQKAKENNIPIELAQEKIDNIIENYIPFYTFFIVILFALVLKVMYPRLYYVEHLIFSLHFITYFLLLWLVLIIVSIKIPWAETFGPIAPLPYLYVALKKIHPAVGWRFIPISVFFLLLFALYIALSMSVGLFLL